MLANSSLVYLECTRRSKLAAQHVNSREFKCSTEKTAARLIIHACRLRLSIINIMLANFSLVYLKCTRRSKLAAQHVNSREFKFLTAYLI